MKISFRNPYPKIYRFDFSIFNFSIGFVIQFGGSFSKLELKIYFNISKEWKGLNEKKDLGS